MGKTSSRGPNTNKHEENGTCMYLRYGLCEMQGWRAKMEDASIAAEEFESNTSLFGVMDGHGGSLVSNFVASNFVGLLTHMKSYKQKKYEQALIETYLKFDELLRMEKVDEFLKQNSKSTQKERNLNVKFISEETQVKQSENKDTQKRYEKSSCSSSSKRDYKNIELKTIRIDKKAVILEDSQFSSIKAEIEKAEADNKEEIILERNYHSESKSNSNNNSPKSLKTSEDSKSDDSIILNNQKLLISNKKDSTDCIISKNYDTLIARDMGTTANILFIKNNQLFLANVGDSMAVLFKNGQAIRLNEEHKVTLPSELARINKSGARILNNRIEGRLNLTRAIGDMCFKKNPNLKFYEQSVTVYPQITNQKITNDCEFIIMACDGVWDCVDAQKLCEFVSQKLKTKMKMSTIISEIFDKILSPTNNTPVGTDNMTCIIIQFIME